jgi:hypothetical protein
MNQEQLVKILKGIRCWTAEGSTARIKLTELIQQLGGNVV